MAERRKAKPPAWLVRLDIISKRVTGFEAGFALCILIAAMIHLSGVAYRERFTPEFDLITTIPLLAPLLGLFFTYGHLGNRNYFSALATTLIGLLVLYLHEGWDYMVYMFSPYVLFVTAWVLNLIFTQLKRTK